MKISQAVAPKKDVKVPFEGAELQVVYRPLTYTVRQMDEMAAEAEATGGGKATTRLLETIQKLVVTWDLTDEHDKLIVIEGDLTDDHPLRDVPSHIFVAIIKAVNEDQTPGGSKASAA